MKNIITIIIIIILGYLGYSYFNNDPDRTNISIENLVSDDVDNTVEEEHDDVEEDDSDNDNDNDNDDDDDESDEEGESNGDPVVSEKEPLPDEGEVMEEQEVDPEPVAKEVSFNVTGGNYWFNSESITVKEGDTVTINFVSEEGFHDWVVDEFEAATERVSSGGQTSVTFMASAAGSYEYYCSVGNHRAQGMVGTLIVE